MEAYEPQQSAPRESRLLRLLRWSLVLAVVALVAACSPLRYYTHVGLGGAKILLQRQPIEEVLERPDLSDIERERLGQVLEIRDFAVRELALPDNASYRTFVRTGRDVVAWNVFAAPPLSVEPVTWCFPIAGCVSYRGYFDQEKARRFARRLERKRELDVAVSGVAAYSTLGWFADPVLDTFLRYPEWQLAGLIFHELAHQVAYAPDDTTFNESFASVVEERGIEVWLEANGRGEQIETARGALREEDRFYDLMLRFRKCLDDLYASAAGDGQKLVRKQEVFELLREEKEALQRRGLLSERYDAWFARPLNNADLAAVADYSALVPALSALLESAGSFEAFYAEVEELAELTVEERRARLHQLVPSVPVEGSWECPIEDLPSGG